MIPTTVFAIIKLILLLTFASMGYIAWQHKRKISLDQLAKDLNPANYDDMDFVACMPPENDDVLQALIRRLLKEPADAWKLRRNATLLLQATHRMDRVLTGEASDILQRAREAAFQVQRESRLVEAELHEKQQCLHGQSLIRAYIRMSDAITYLAEIAG